MFVCGFFDFKYKSEQIKNIMNQIVNSKSVNAVGTFQNGPRQLLLWRILSSLRSFLFEAPTGNIVKLRVAFFGQVTPSGSLYKLVPT